MDRSSLLSMLSKYMVSQLDVHRHGGDLVSLEVLGHFPGLALEGTLVDEKPSGLLLHPDVPEDNGAKPVSVGLLHSPGGRFMGSLGGQLLLGGIAASGLSNSLNKKESDIISPPSI